MIKDKLQSLPKLFKSNGAINGNLFRNGNNKELYDSIISNTAWINDSEPFHMRVYCILNDINEYPLCGCDSGNTLSYADAKVGFRSYCSQKCTLKHHDNGLQFKGRKNTVEAIEKQKQTMKERYGVDNYFKHPDFIKNNYTPELVSVRDRNRDIALKKKYGNIKSVFQLDTIKEKIASDNIEKYGVANQTQKHFSQSTIDALNNVEYMRSMSTQYTLRYIGDILSCDSSTVHSYLKRHGIQHTRKTSSTEELKVENMLNELNYTDYQKDTNHLLCGRKEIDFYFEDYNFAVEVNGLYWHSESIRPDRKFHQKKFDMLNDKGIKLIQFWDYEINNKPDLIKSIIANNLKLSTTKVFARKCTIKKVPTVDAVQFICDNHIQDITSANISHSYGLYYNDVLMSCMTFIRTDRLDDVYTLQRFCSLKYHNVVGGFTRLLKHFIKTHNPNTVISFSDCRYSNGNVYKQNGFTHVSSTDSYYYTKDYKSLENRWNYKKSDIMKKYPLEYDNKLTEHQNMINIGYDRVNGCSIYKWVLTT